MEKILTVYNFWYQNSSEERKTLYFDIGGLPKKLNGERQIRTTYEEGFWKPVKTETYMPKKGKHFFLTILTLIHEQVLWFSK